MIKRAFFSFLFSALVLGAPYVWRDITGEFRFGKLAFDLPYNPNWDSTAIADDNFFQGTFTFLAQGGQSFVFQSEDGQWVLKLFRYDRWIHPWRKFVRNKWLGKQERLPYDQKIDRLFCSTKLAYEQAADLTGLAYIHLNTDDRLPIVSLKDRLGRVYPIDLSKTYFAIQRKADPLPQVFLETMQKGDEERFNLLTHSFVDLLKKRTARGIRNTDTKVHLNFGFWGTQCVEWDFGNYCIDPELRSEEGKNQEIHRFLLKPMRHMNAFWAEQFQKEALQ